MRRSTLSGARDLAQSKLLPSVQKNTKEGPMFAVLQWDHIFYKVQLPFHGFKSHAS